MLKDVYSEAKHREIRRVRIEELLEEWKKEHAGNPSDLDELIEGVCE